MDSSTTSIDADAFVAAITPALQKRDTQQMLEICKANWTADQVVSLLSCDNRDARKVAALALSLAGCQHCLEPLAKARVYEFAFVMQPLKLQGATGSTVAPTAIR